jgi:type II secretory pathway predicted ATPase ExeA
MISPQRRNELIDALRRGTVPQRSLDVLAIGLERFEGAFAEELSKVKAGGACFKAIRGEYGSGKTFVARWMQERAKRDAFVTSEVQISETETPLHRLETVYRRLIERLSTTDQAAGAFRSVIDQWFYALESDLSAGGATANDARIDELLEKRLASVSRESPSFAAALRGYRRAVSAGERDTADALIAWVGGQPNVAAQAKRTAGIKGEIDHAGALSSLQGLLTIIRDCGQAGLVLVIDEVETLQRVRGDVRDKSLNALRQLVDEVDSGRFPGLYVVITGTPAFFDGPQGVQRLAPLAQRLATDFTTEARFDNPRAPQIRLPGFDLPALVQLGCKVRDIYVEGRTAGPRIAAKATDEYVGELARAVAGHLGGKVGVVPRLFLRKLIGDVLDRIDQFDDFDPRLHYKLTVKKEDLTRVESAAMAHESVDDVELDLP